MVEGAAAGSPGALAHPNRGCAGWRFLVDASPLYAGLCSNSTGCFMLSHSASRTYGGTNC